MNNPIQITPEKSMQITAHASGGVVVTFTFRKFGIAHSESQIFTTQQADQLAIALVQESVKAAKMVKPS